MIPLLAGTDHRPIAIGILEVECRDELSETDIAELTVMASVLAITKLLEQRLAQTKGTGA